MATPSLVQSIAYTADQSNGDTGSSSLSGTLTLPAAPTAGNYLVFVMGGDKNTGTLTLNGFTVWHHLFSSGATLYVAVRQSDGTEQTINFSWANSSPSGNVPWYGEYAQAGTGDWAVGAHVGAAYGAATSYASGTSPASTLDEGLAIAAVSFDSASSQSTPANATFSGGFTRTYTGPATITSAPGLFLAEKATVLNEQVASTFSMGAGGSADEGNIGIIVIGRGAGTTPPTSTLVSRWLGAVTATGATVVTTSTDATTARLKVATDSALTTGVVYSAQVTPDALGYSRMAVTGLTAGTTYYYGVELDGVVTGGIESFATFPTGRVANLEIAFASCGNPGSASPTFAAIRARNPDLFLALGDTPYIDTTTNDEAVFRAEFDAVLADAEWGPTLRQIPNVYIFSDHDFTTDQAFKDSESAAAAQANYRRVVPHHPLIATDGKGIYQKFVIGQYVFLLTDGRSYRDWHSDPHGPNKSKLGLTQRQWLIDELTALAADQVGIIVTDSPWVGPESQTDTWQAYDDERQAIGTAAAGKNVMILAGDMHALAHDDGTNSVGGIPVFQAAPLSGTSSLKGGPYSSGTYPATAGVSSTKQYGWLVLSEAADTVTATFTGYDSTDTVRLSATETFSTASTATGTVVDKWDGTNLVRQRIDKWSGSALVLQKLE